MLTIEQILTAVRTTKSKPSEDDLRWQPEEDTMAKSLYETGTPLEEMERQLGRGRNAINVMQ
ncbi:MAG: hypothetical protein ABIB93_03340 [Chloroflexota bacterium]